MSNASFADELIHFIIGGVHYSLLRFDLEAHPDCYLASSIKDEWKPSDGPIVIHRDGVVFHHIYVYLYCFRTTMPFSIEGPLSLLVDIRREADYFNLPKLVALCDKTFELKLQVWCQHLDALSNIYRVQVDVADETELDIFVKSELYPACHTGTLDATRYAARQIAESLSWRTESPGARKKNVHYFSLRALDVWYERLQFDLPTLPGVKCGLVSGSLYAITKDGFEQTPPPADHRTNRVGTIVYLLKSKYTGGAITATHNGIAKTIAKPGEYLMYTNDFMREIGTVTSGVLVFVTFNIVRFLGQFEQDDVDDFEAVLVKHNALPSRDSFTHAVQSELRLNELGVVLCLSTLYPASSFDPAGPYLETDPDSLTDRDAALYEYLKDTFDVTLVTVCVLRHSRNSAACVLGSPLTTSDFKIKIIAPFHGFRDTFTVDKAGGKHATLYTALYIKQILA